MRVRVARVYADFLEDRRFIWCFISAMVTGLVCYGYYLVNNMQNFDNINNIPYSVYEIGGTMIDMGRWSLEISGALCSKFYKGFNIVWLNGLITIALYGITSYVLVKTFAIYNKLSCVAVSAITVAFPSVASSMFFAYTMQYYAFSMLLAAFSVYLVQKRKLSACILAGVLLAWAMGTYQAVFPFAAGLLVLLLTMQLLDEEFKLAKFGVSAAYYVGLLVAGFALYEISLKTILTATGAVLRQDRSAFATLGKLNAEILYQRILKAYGAFMSLPKQELMAITAPSMNKICILLLELCIVLCYGCLFVKRSKVQVFLSFALAVSTLPLTTMFLCILLSFDGVYTLLLFSVLPFFYFPCILSEKVYFKQVSAGRIIWKLCCFILIFISVNWCYVSNVNYSALYFSNRKVENYYTMMFAQIRNVQGYTEDKQIIFVGNQIRDSVFEENWELRNYVIGGNCLSQEQINVYSRNKFIENYLGLRYSYASTEMCEKYADEISELNCYPNYGSIRVIDDVVLVKLE